MILLVILIYSMLGIYEFVPLYKQRLWSDFSVNAVLAVLSFIVAVLLCFNVRIPSPEEPIRKMIIFIFGK